MKIAGFDAWRLLFVVAALFILVGGPQHPGGTTMAEMLGDPIWVQAHLLVLAGFLALLVGLIMLRSGSTLWQGGLGPIADLPFTSGGA